MTGTSVERPYSQIILTVFALICFGLFSAGVTIAIQALGVGVDRAYVLLAIMAVVFVVSIIVATRSGRFSAASYRWQHWLALVVPILFITRITAFFEVGAVEAPGLGPVGFFYGLLDFTVFILSAVLALVWVVGMRIARAISLLHPQTSEVPPAIRSPEYYEWLTGSARHVDRGRVVAELTQIVLTGGGLLVGLTTLTAIVAAEQSSGELIGAGLVLVVLYFISVMLLVSYANLIRRTSQWSVELASVAPGLTGTWIRSSLIILAVALVIAMFLPAIETDTFVIVGQWLIDQSFRVAQLVVGLAIFAFAMIVRLFEFLRPETEGVETPPAQEPAAGAETGTSISVPEIVGGLVAIVAIAVTLYALYQILLGRSWGRPRPVEWMRARLHAAGSVVWALAMAVIGFVRWGREVAAAVGIELTTLARGRGAPASVLPAGARGRDREMSTREGVHQLYVQLVRDAELRGIRRAPAETPPEFQTALAAACTASGAEMEDLTRLFIAARYSSRDVPPGDLARAERCLSIVRNELRRADDP